MSYNYKYELNTIESIENMLFHNYTDIEEFNLDNNKSNFDNDVIIQGIDPVIDSLIYNASFSYNDKNKISNNTVNKNNCLKNRFIDNKNNSYIIDFIDNNNFNYKSFDILQFNDNHKINDHKRYSKNINLNQLNYEFSSQSFTSTSSLSSPASFNRRSPDILGSFHSNYYINDEYDNIIYRKSLSFYNVNILFLYFIFIFYFN